MQRFRLAASPWRNRFNRTGDHAASEALSTGDFRAHAPCRPCPQLARHAGQGGPGPARRAFRLRLARAAAGPADLDAWRQSWRDALAAAARRAVHPARRRGAGDERHCRFRATALRADCRQAPFTNTSRSTRRNSSNVFSITGVPTSRFSPSPSYGPTWSRRCAGVGWRWCSPMRASRDNQPNAGAACPARRARSSARSICVSRRTPKMRRASSGSARPMCELAAI